MTRVGLVLAGALVACVAAGTATAQVVFNEVASEVGIDFVLQKGTRLPFPPGTPDEAKPLLDVIQRNQGNGVAVGDYDGDGDPDVYMLGQNGFRNVLYRNMLVETGALSFVDATAAAGLENLGMSRVAMFVDLDNDRDPDLILVNDSDDSGLNALSAIYRNDGTGVFTDVTAGSGFRPDGYVKGGLGVTDYDQDGLLDIYVVNWGAYQEEGFTYMPGHNRLYRNLGGFRFDDVTLASGLGPIQSNSFTPIFADFDNDHDADLYLPIDAYADFYFRNDNGVFVNRTTLTGSGHVGTDMGAATTDFDQDGDLDLYCANVTDPLGRFGGNTLLVNQLAEAGRVVFPDQAVERGVHESGWGWGVEWFDPDNNGLTDLFVVNGYDEWVRIVYDGEREAGLLNRPNSLFLNDGTGRFTEQPSLVGDSKSVIAFDADLDGDQDLLVVNIDAAPFFLRNDSAPATVGNWLQVDLDGGTVVNREGIGARVEVLAGGRTQQQEVIGGGSYLAGRPTEAHFGLGTAPVVDRLRVIWPGGGETVLTGVAVNQRITVQAMATPEVCNDGADNDFDGRSDCGDFDCVGAAGCQVAPQVVLFQNFDAGTGSFGFTDGAFRGTSNAAYASGTHGFGQDGNGGVRVRLGGVDDVEVLGMSGGYESPFTLRTAPDTVRIRFGYDLYFNASYEADECGQVLVSVDGVLVTNGPDDFVVEVCGGTGLQGRRTGIATIDVPLASGGHTILIGAYNNKKDSLDESMNLYLDNVVVETLGIGASEACGDGLDNDGDLAVDCADPDCAQYVACRPEDACDDGVDNDSDGRMDCADPDCAGDPVCAAASQVLVSQDFDVDTGTFIYLDDTFRGTSNPAYASGTHGFGQVGDGGVRVRLGGVDSVEVLGMSGGYESPFTLRTVPDTVRIRFGYDLYFNASYEADECGQLLVSVDGLLVTNGPDDFVVEVCGGTGLQGRRTGVASIDVPLAWGTHTVVIGGYNSKKNSLGESMDLYLDDVVVETLGIGASEACGDGLDNDGDLAVDCADPDCAQYVACRPEDACADGVDNDSDGRMDCADLDCAGDPVCAAASQILVSQDFDLNTGSFIYLDDTFRGTSNPAYASGKHGFGQSGNGGVRVRLGGVDGTEVLGMSGGCRSPFTLATVPDTVRIRFGYDLYFNASYEADECGQLLVSVDGVLVTNGPDDFVVEVCGGTGLQGRRTGIASIDVPLAWGTHTLVIGGYNSKKNSLFESMDLYLDNVVVETLGVGASEVCTDYLDNDGDLLADCADPDCASHSDCLPEAECDDGFDNDRDGIIDCADADCATDPWCLDSDHDGIFDAEDNCPTNANPFQGDVNGDGIGDDCQPDDFDRDGWPDLDDNCPDDPNPDQVDGDGNGVGDVCDGRSMARIWNEQLLHAIRHDLARPTVHARNLYHVSAAMWDAWAAYDPSVSGIFHNENAVAADVAAARNEAIAYAAYRVLVHRFATSVGANTSLPRFDAKMAELGYDIAVTTTEGDLPAALGNRIAAAIIEFGLADGSNEANNYVNQYYEPVNPPLLPDLPGNPDIIDPNRWQPLVLDFFIDQSGNPIPGGFPEFLSPEWGQVVPFALSSDDLTVYSRDGFDYWVYHDPGSPPLVGGVGDEYYKWGNELVVAWSSQLDPADGVMWDISPASLGNSPLPEADDYEAYYDLENGGDWGTGHPLNPITGLPYEPQIVPRGDYARVLAEFWADGPQSETPPGHWFAIANYVSDHPLFVKRMGGTGPVLDDLEWDVKLYLMMGGSMHDCAITAWGIKGWYDYIRPVSAIRYLADQGQSSDPAGPSYDPSGIGLHPGFIEVVTAESSAPGQRHEHLSNAIGKIAVRAWNGPEYIEDPQTDTAGVGWILAENWWPYQRPTFVTPPFAGFVSGHSTYSRAASELLTIVTGSPFFPGGMGEFHAPQNEFLDFEEGPTQSITLQWATYYDASDQTSLSRIWGGIHPPGDDLPGRIMGQQVARDAVELAQSIFGEAACNDLIDNDGDGLSDLDDPGCSDPSDPSE